MSFLISGLTANIQLPCPERNVPAQFLMCRSPSHVAGSISAPQRKFPNRALQMIFAAWFRLIKALLRDWLPHSEVIGIWELVFFPDSRSGLHGAWHFRTEGCQCS